MMSTRESTSHSHGHGHLHHGSAQSPAAIAERLLELKNSDPELFSQAWKQLPQSTQDNIIAYLKKHGSDAKVQNSAHENFEDKSVRSHRHKALMENPSEPDSLEEKDYESKHTIASPSTAEMRKTVHTSGRPLYEWTDGELLAHTLIETEGRGNVQSGQGEGESDLSSILRSISKQNTVQIVQNELIRRLLQTIAGKA